jgi:hypothetical protein
MYRQQYGVARGGDVDRRERHDEGADGVGGPRVTQAFAEYHGHGAAGTRRRFGADPQQADQQGEVGHRVEREADGLGRQLQQEARQGRADEACNVEHHRVERERIGQIALAAHIAAVERLT